SDSHIENFKGEAASNRGFQPSPRTRKQGKSRGRTPSNAAQEALRGNVGSIREAASEEANMNTGELRLVGIAAALITSKSTLTSAEKKLIRDAGCADKNIVAEYRRRIAEGDDILGSEFCKLRAPEVRRETGATYTPPVIVGAMISWAASIHPAPERVVD